jgi:hypothetical protein
LVWILDGRAKQRLEQADTILEARIGQVNEAVQQSIVRADGAVEARIAQLDELTGRRLGNVDVIATKQSLNIEGSLLKVAALVALSVFLVFVLREISRDIDAYYDQIDKPTSRVRSAVGATGHVLKGVAKRLVVEGRDDPGAGERRQAAARAAAELGLYTGPVGARQPLGMELLPPDAPAGVRDAVVSAYDARHLRFL